LINYGPLRSGGKIVFETFNTICGTFSEHFDSPVRAVANVANNLMSRGSPLGKKTISNTLHLSAYQESSCYYRLHFRR